MYAYDWMLMPWMLMTLIMLLIALKFCKSICRFLTTCTLSQSADSRFCDILENAAICKSIKEMQRSISSQIWKQTSCSYFNITQYLLNTEQWHYFWHHCIFYRIHPFCPMYWFKDHFLHSFQSLCSFLCFWYWGCFSKVVIYLCYICTLKMSRARKVTV